MSEEGEEKKKKVVGPPLRLFSFSIPHYDARLLHALVCTIYQQQTTKNKCINHKRRGKKETAEEARKTICSFYLG